MIKAIDTVYNGYKFRSRLEARWAVFFDALDIKYEYELQGYNINGKNYLPDFFLTELNTFAEVKYRKLTLEEFETCAELTKELSTPVVLLDGVPEERHYFICLPNETLQALDTDPYDEYTSGNYWSVDFLDIAWTKNLSLYFSEYRVLQRVAIDLALHSRFEHGEYPDVQRIQELSKLFSTNNYRDASNILKSTTTAP